MQAKSAPRISHAVLLTSAQLCRGLARLLFVLVVARELVPQRFGVYALLLATVEILAVASGSGYADYLTREAARDASVGWGLGLQLTLLRLVCLVPLVGAGVGILGVLGYSRMVVAAAGWLSLSLVPRSVSKAVQGVLRGIGRDAENLIVELFFELALVGGVAFLLMKGGGLRAVVAIEIAAAASAAIASMAFVLMFRTKVRATCNPFAY